MSVKHFLLLARREQVSQNGKEALVPSTHFHVEFVFKSMTHIRHFIVAVTLNNKKYIKNTFATVRGALKYKG